jgi:hypothetical protein
MPNRSVAIIAASLFLASPALEASTSLELALAPATPQAGAGMLDPANGAASSGCRSTASSAAGIGVSSPMPGLPLGVDAVKTMAPPPPQALNCFWKICPDGDLRYSKPGSCTC